MSRNNTERGAVLVVALVMLAMVTFLVVAFVGFARFERASVTASLKRTEAIFIQGNSQSVSRKTAVNHVFIDSNATPTIRVSQRFSTNQNVPVYIDTTGDGVQDTNSTYLNLNAEVNNPLLGGDLFFQPSNPEALVFGDPEWIGLLENPNEPHGPENHFVARTAYMVVPVSEILNVRYNHRFGTSALNSHYRGQGGSPRSIDLAAPLFHMHPEWFSAPRRNPYLYAGAMHELGAAVRDAYFYGRPSFEFKQSRIENKTTPVTFRAHQAAEKLLTETDLAGGFGDSLNTWFRENGEGKKPYGLYKFLGTFSAAELPEEKMGFDVSSIRDESTSGFGYPEIDALGGSVVRFLQPHGLKDGDKIEEQVGLPPHIVDPIKFDLVASDPAEIKALLIKLIQGGSLLTTVPHRLNPGDTVSMVMSGIDSNWRILARNKPSDPWVPISSSPGIVTPNMIQVPASGRLPLHWKTVASKLNFPSSTPLTHKMRFSVDGESAVKVNFNRFPPPVEYAWGIKDTVTGGWVSQMLILEDPGAPLPASLQDVTCQLVYRPTPWLADNIPYFTKVWDKQTVSLHRSAQLDEQSRVQFRSNPDSIPFISPGLRSVNTGDVFKYEASGEFITSYPNRWFNGDFVRFLSNASFSSGGAVHPDHVFQMKLIDTTATEQKFKLSFVEPPYGELKLTDAKSYKLHLVHRFKTDRLADAVEKMAGAMLNESLDVESGGVTPFKLGGQTLSIPDPSNSFPLIYGIGGHHEPMGLWHQTNGGIPIVSYTNETERILQVAANIAEIYSDPPLTQLKGRDVVYSSGMKYLPSGEAAAADGTVSAQMRYLVVSKAGIDYGPYRAFFEPDLPFKISDGFVRGTIKLIEKVAFDFDKDPTIPPNDKLLAQSAPCRVRLYEEQANSGSWKWNLEEWVWKNGYAVSAGKFQWLGLHLAIEMESGRFIKVFLDGKEVVNYASSLRVGPELGAANWKAVDPSTGNLRQGGLWSLGGEAYFTRIHPAVPAPGGALPAGWGYQSNTRPANSLPNAYEGVFRRDNLNNVYLSGLQRRPWFTGDDSATSWYRRGAPKILGVKDRSGTYAGRMPAISEVSLRLTYDRIKNKVMGRLAMEVNMPPAGRLASCRLQFKELTLSGNGVAEYRDANGFNAQDGPSFTLSMTTNRLMNLITGSAGIDVSSVLVGSDISSIDRVISDAATGTVKSLADIKFSDLQVSFKAQIIAFTPSNEPERVVDFFDGTLALPSARLGKPMVNHELHAPVWNATDAGGYGVGKVVLDPDNYNYYQLLPSGSGTVKPPATGWAQLIGRKFRKIDLSSQVNDPLVNGSQRGWQTRVYAPTYVSAGKLVSNLNETKVLWSPAADPAITPGKMYTAASFAGEFGRSLRHHFGVNLCRLNDAWHPWGKTNTGGKNDSSIKDPAINPYYNWWKFPDVMRGGVKSVGWLGQVHRGTPWQTLYLKSKPGPGVVAIQSINDDTGVITTVEPHNLGVGDVVGFSGKKHDTWTAPGDYLGKDYVVKLVVGPNQYTLTEAGLDAVINWNKVGDGFYLTPDLFLDSKSWTDWAGSSDTKPVNDRRLLEAFYVSHGKKVRGRLSVNNRTPEAWSGVLHGVSLPFIPDVVGSPPSPKRILGVYTGQTGWSSNYIETDKGDADTKWNFGILGGIAAERKKGRFKRATDILGAPQLTDQSPYLPTIVGAANLDQYYSMIDKVDELDIERIPMQILSQLKAGGPQRYQMYIFTQQLKPARRYQLPGKKGGPGFDDDGNVYNYEVVSQTAQRVLVELIGAEEWHESLKSGHYGQYRDVDGSLKDLPKPYPKIIRKYPIDMGY